MAVKDLKEAKVLHMRISFGGASGAMKEVREQQNRVCHAFDYQKLGKYVILAHERDEFCSWCGEVDDYTQFV